MTHQPHEDQSIPVTYEISKPSQLERESLPVDPRKILGGFRDLISLTVRAISSPWPRFKSCGPSKYKVIDSTLRRLLSVTARKALSLDTSRSMSSPVEATKVSETDFIYLRMLQVRSSPTGYSECKRLRL